VSARAVGGRGGPAVPLPQRRQEIVGGAAPVRNERRIGGDLPLPQTVGLREHASIPARQHPAEPSGSERTGLLPPFPLYSQMR